MPSFVSRLAVVVVPLLFTVGCAVESGSEAPTEDDMAESEEALSACGSAQYGEALAHYKAAVKAAQSRLREGVCQSDDGFLQSIADHASRAVMTCGTFRSVIRTSPWAAPVRTTLARTNVSYSIAFHVPYPCRCIAAAQLACRRWPETASSRSNRSTNGLVYVWQSSCTNSGR